MSRYVVRSGILLAFFGSGAAGLLYETVWVQQCACVLGSTLRAGTLVIAAFMGGLSLGSRLAGPRADAARRPLGLYAALEILVAVSALAVSPGLDLLRLARAALPSFAATGMEDLGTIVLLLVPTALMGATMPVLCKAASEGEDPAATLADLYAVNTLGAVTGGIGGAYVLVRLLGLAATARAAAFVNVLAAALAIAAEALGGRPAGRLSDRAAAAGDAGTGVEEGAPARVGPLWVRRGKARGVTWRVLRVYLFVSGFVAMLYEVALLRLMPLVIGSSIYAFALVVSTFILGTALGSAVGGALVRRGIRSAGALGVTQILLGLTMIASIPACNALPGLYVWLRSAIGSSFYPFQGLVWGLSAAVTLGPTLLMGCALPLAAAALDHQGNAGDLVGRLYATSTLGNIAGTALTGLVLVPAVGFERAIEIGAALAALAGAGLLVRDRASGGASRRWALALALVAGAVFALTRPSIDMLLLTSHPFRGKQAGDDPSAWSQTGLTQGRTLLYVAEDGLSTVSVERYALHGELFLQVNGKPDASSIQDMLTQRMLGHVPMLLHHDPRRVLIVGLGSGVTLGSVLAHPVDRVRAVEISWAVIGASAFFAAENRRCLGDPRVELVVDDARASLDRCAERFDCIVSEPSNPWFSSISRLYSQECFRLERDHLAPGGLMVQWFHGYEMDLATFQLVLRTFRSVFAHVTVMTACDSDYLFLGSMAPIDPDVDRLAQRMAAPLVSKDLAALDVSTPLTVLGYQVIAPDEVDRVAGEGPLNTDDHPLLEYEAPMHFHSGLSVSLPATLRYANAPDGFVQRYMSSHRVSTAEKLAFTRHFGDVYPPAATESMVRELLKEKAANPEARFQLAHTYVREQRPREALDLLDSLVGQFPSPEAVLAPRCRLALELARCASGQASATLLLKALESASSWAAVEPANPLASLALAQVRFARGEWELALPQFGRSAIRLRAQEEPEPELLCEALVGAAGCQLLSGNLDRALSTWQLAQGLRRPREREAGARVGRIEAMLAIALARRGAQNGVAQAVGSAPH